jgi:plastocyanin
MRGRRIGVVGMAIVLATGMAACGSEEDDGAESSNAAAVEVVMTDYAYAVSGDLPAGGTLRMINDGAETHMVAIGLLRDGMGLADVQGAIESGEDAAFEEVFGDEIGAPGNILSAGSTAEITVPDLGAGEYALMCFIPTVGSGLPHAAQGMVSLVTVTDEAAEPAAGDVALTVVPGEAVDGPTELTAGHHLFDVTLDGDVADLEPALLRIADGEDVESTFATIDAEFETAFNAAEGPTAELAAEVAALLVVAIHDLGEASSIQLGFDLEPGAYALVFTDTDVDGPKDLTTRLEFTVT